MKNLSDIAIAILLWALLLVKMGYHYGTNDHVELLPYVLYLQDSTLFAHDFFIQSLHASLPNERSVFAHLLLPFATYLSPVIFLLHLFTTVLLLLGLQRIAHLFLKGQWWSWLSVVLAVVLLHDRALGNVDLYSTSLQASDVACMMLVWSIYYFAQQRYAIAWCLLIPASFIHVLEGMDVAIVLMAILCIQAVLNNIHWRQVAIYIGVYLVMVAPYLFCIYRAKTATGSPITDNELFWILFVFRHPHHFIFSMFPIFNKLLFLLFSVAAIHYYATRNMRLFLFVLVAIAGLVVYVLAVDFFHLVFVANFQWYKLTVYVKFLGVVALVAMLKNAVPCVWQYTNTYVSYVVMLAGLLAGSYFVFQFATGKMKKGYRSNEYLRDEIAICEQAKMLTPQNAVFIVPFEFTAMKFYGQRACYVEFKAIAKNKRDIPLWYARIHQVYGLDYSTPISGFAMRDRANAFLNNMTDTQLRELKNQGVQYMIATSNRYAQTHTLLAQNGNYYLYRL